MTTYFAWAKADEVFDPDRHNRCDVDILSLEIRQREGEVALAWAHVYAIELPEWDRRSIFISHQTASGAKQIFSGHLVGTPMKIKNHLITLEFSAEPRYALKSLQALQSSLKQPPFWDALFVDPLDHDHPTEWLEARSALYAWDRVTGDVSASDLFQGSQSIDMTGDVFADSLTLSLTDPPLSAITVRVCAEWVQKMEGEFPLTLDIAKAFPAQMINTLTPQALMAGWPQAGKQLGQSGYMVSRSRLERIVPPSTGLLNIYPTLSPEFVIDDEAGNSRMIRAYRVWFQGMLELAWRYHQKRREILQFTLYQDSQITQATHPSCRTLQLSLQSIDSDVAGMERCSSFFATERGEQAMIHAIEIAKAHLASSSRCLEVTVKMSFEKGLFLSVDHNAELYDKRLPGGHVMGKIIEYRLVHRNVPGRGMISFTFVRLAVALGIHQPQKKEMESGMRQTPSGIVYRDYREQKPIQGMVDADSLNLVHDIVVSHHAAEQIEFLQNQDRQTEKGLAALLSQNPTAIHIHLQNLKTIEIAEHVITVDLPFPWSAPAQAILHQ